MTYQHKIVRTYRNGGDTTITTATQTTTGGIEVNLNEAVPGSATTALVIGVDKDTIQSFVMTCDVACTVGINDDYSGSPAGKWTLAAGQVFIWTKLDPKNDGTAQSCPITSDVTSIHVTLAGATAGTFSFSVLCDPTP